MGNARYYIHMVIAPSSVCPHRSFLAMNAVTGDIVIGW